MFKSFFQARDALDRAVLADELHLTYQQLAVFRFLLSHAFYDHRYGFVNDKVWGTDTIAKLTGFSERAVGPHLRSLQSARLIHRRPRPFGTGGSRPDEITITWPVFHAEDEAEPAEVAVSEGADPADLVSDSAGSAVSFQEKKSKKTSSSRRADDEAASPSGEDRAKSSTRSAGTSRAKDEYPVDPGFLEDLTESINEFLANFAVPCPVPFSFGRLGRADQSRVPGLIEMLYREDPFYTDDLIWGLVKERGDTLEKIQDGARWLATVLRGVSEAELRKWIARGKEYHAVQEQAEERAQREEEELIEQHAVIIAADQGIDRGREWARSMLDYHMKQARGMFRDPGNAREHALGRMREDIKVNASAIAKYLARAGK